jgi:glycosyltransferase involved in cell wall biosynthesis
VEILMLMTDRFCRGGTQTDIVQLAGALVARGHDVHVAAAAGEMTRTLERTGARFHEVRQPLGSPAAVLACALDVDGVLRRNNIGVLAPQSVRATMAAGLLRRLGRASQPVVTSIHNLHTPSGAAQARRVLRHFADVVTFENRYERDLVGLDATAVGEACPIVYSGIDLERFRPSSAPLTIAPSTGRRAICVARLSEEKNHELLLEAWARHVRTAPHDRLSVVGDGPLRLALEAQRARLGLVGSVTMLGDRDDIPELLRGSDLFVLASNRESYPRAAREALACGVPVVLPAIGACGEIACDPGCSSLFTSRDVASLADHLDHWLDPTRNRALTAAAARGLAARLFPRERWVDTMEAIYLRVGGERVAGRAA